MSKQNTISASIFVIGAAALALADAGPAAWAAFGAAAIATAIVAGRRSKHA